MRNERLAFYLSRGSLRITVYFGCAYIASFSTPAGVTGTFIEYGSSAEAPGRTVLETPAG